MSVIFYGCVSLDGYLAGENHELDWLFASGSTEETNYETFYDSIDMTIMGRNTFDAVSQGMSFKEVYPRTENIVFTHRHDRQVEGATFVSGDVVDFVKGLEADKKIWLVGGGRLLQELLEAQLVDKLIIQIAPVLIGKGLPLFQKSQIQQRFTLSDVKKYGQFAELIYEKKTGF